MPKTNSSNKKAIRATTVAIFASAAAFSSFTTTRIPERKRVRKNTQHVFEGSSSTSTTRSSVGLRIEAPSLHTLHQSKQDDVLETMIFPLTESTTCTTDIMTQILNPEFTDGLSSLEHDRSSASSHSMTAGDTSLTYEEQRHQFEMHVGKAVDTLRHDYPNILVANPGTFGITNEQTLESEYGLMVYVYHFSPFHL